MITDEMKLLNALYAERRKLLAEKQSAEKQSPPKQLSADRRADVLVLASEVCNLINSDIATVYKDGSKTYDEMITCIETCSSLLGKHMKENSGGTNSPVITPRPTVTMVKIPPPVIQIFNSGKPFRPRPIGACVLYIQCKLNGKLGTTETLTVGISPNHAAGYVTISSLRLSIHSDQVGEDLSSITVIVPEGYWVTISLTGSLTASCLRTDL